MVGEVVDEVLASRIFQHSFDLSFDDFRIRKFALGRQNPKLFIEHSIPQQITHARRDREIVKLAGRFVKVNESRRTEDRTVADSKCAHKVIRRFQSLACDFEIRRDIIFLDRSSKSFLGEAVKQVLQRFVWILCSDRTLVLFPVSDSFVGEQQFANYVIVDSGFNSLHFKPFDRDARDIHWAALTGFDLAALKKAHLER